MVLERERATGQSILFQIKELAALDPGCCQHPGWAAVDLLSLGCAAAHCESGIRRNLAELQAVSPNSLHCGSQSI